MMSSNFMMWAGILLITFCVFYVVATILRNHAAKKDSVGKSEADAVDSSVSLKPRENTRKLD